MKALTPAQLESRKEKAVRFTRDVLGDPDRAEEIADESLEDYAERRKIQITNPPKRRNALMATTKSKAELEAEIDDLKDENAELQFEMSKGTTPCRYPNASARARKKSARAGSHPPPEIEVTLPPK